MPSAGGDRPTIIWFRNDLRLADNPALAGAAQTGTPVLGVYVLETDETGKSHLGDATKWWLHHSLEQLSNALKGHGVPLALLKGDANSQIQRLVSETNAATVFWNRRYDAAGMGSDKSLKEQLKASGTIVESFNGSLLAEPWELRTSSGGPYRVYSPFWRALRARGQPDAPLTVPDGLIRAAKLPGSLSLADLDLLPTGPDWAHGLRETWAPGETGAWKRLAAFLDGTLERYAKERDIPDASATSMLSPHLRFGEISPRQIWNAACHHTAVHDIADKALEKFLSELAWREFSYHLLYHFPSLPRQNHQPKFDEFPWRDDAEAFAAWAKGKTGYPLVDAGMRELWHTGYMHNRVRMVVASFLIKHLMIDWRRGADWFWDTLVDADIANNSASWQWIAGSGADAAPYFRIFNPTTQGEKFDARGTYTRRWVPELAELPDKYLFRPFEAPEHVLKTARVKLGETYPTPLVDHASARTRALAAFQSLSSAA